MACEHQYAYQGVQYAEGAYNRPGSGAKSRYYSHVYFCSVCLDKKYEQIENIDDNSYNAIRFNAVPGDPKFIVPDHDQPYSRR